MIQLSSNNKPPKGLKTDIQFFLLNFWNPHNKNVFNQNIVIMSFTHFLIEFM